MTKRLKGRGYEEHKTTSKWNREIKKQFCYISMLTAVILVILVFFVARPLVCNNINNEKNMIFSDPWQYSVDDGEFHTVTLPHSEKGKVKSHLTLKNRLPDNLLQGEAVLLRTSQQYVEVFIDGSPVYNSFGDAADPNTPASAYHFIRMPADSAGKEIKIELRAPIARYAGMMNDIYIGSKSSHLFFLFQKNGFHFLTGILLFVSGMMMVLVFSFVRVRQGKKAIIYLGAFFVCAGFWLAAESHLLQFIIPYSMVVTNLGMLALSLMPVFLGLHYCSLNKLYLTSYGRYGIAGAVITCAVIAACACINPLLPLKILPFYLVFLGAFVCVTLVGLLIKSIVEKIFYIQSIWAGIIFCIFALLELIDYLYSMETYNKSNFLTVGLLLFSLLKIVSTIGNFSKMYRDSIKVNTLTNLVYTDSLTGVKNRTAFLEQIAKIEVDRESCIIVGMFDVNNLKLVNDNLGHLVGDAMLSHSARTIKAALNYKDELYRIGGDEFVAIIRHEKEADLKELEARLDAAIEGENQKPLNYKLSVAYGYALFSADCDTTLFDTLNRADAKMYTYKKMQKGQMFSTQKSNS